mmetsp:Transcript_91847/g.263051  ORF Transcript_91847/g.263051 Transcript_91847/m.263051 type:complete len:247 (+) Transcript_91847:239-979(+)
MRPMRSPSTEWRLLAAGGLIAVLPGKFVALEVQLPISVEVDRGSLVVRVERPVVVRAHLHIPAVTNGARPSEPRHVEQLDVRGLLHREGGLFAELEGLPSAARGQLTVRTTHAVDPMKNVVLPIQLPIPIEVDDTTFAALVLRHLVVYAYLQVSSRQPSALLGQSGDDVVVLALLVGLWHRGAAAQEEEGETAARPARGLFLQTCVGRRRSDNLPRLGASVDEVLRHPISDGIKLPVETFRRDPLR